MWSSDYVGQSQYHQYLSPPLDSGNHPRPQQLARMNEQTYPIVHGFKLVQKIAEGASGIIYRAVDYDERTTAACKLVRLTPNTNPEERKSLSKEIAVHRILKHRNVLEFIDYLIIEPLAGSPHYPGVYMLLEFAAGGDLFDKIEPEVGVGVDVAQHYFRQLALGLEYIHKSGFCHRDMKAENVVLNFAGELKICDFGLCGVFAVTNKKGKKETRRLRKRYGSLPYMAPELLESRVEPYAAEPIDIWGIGLILYGLLSGSTTPWDEASLSSSEYTRYYTGEIFDSEPWCRFERDALDLITGMLTPDPARRMTLNDIFHHRWTSRENSLSQRSTLCAADALTQGLRDAGTLDIVMPLRLAPLDRRDEDGDQIMLTAASYSQFSQTLLLFSQEGAPRYTPSWTRFYAYVPPERLYKPILEALGAHSIKYKNLRVTAPRGRRLRIKGYDARRLEYHGTIALEAFNAPESGVLDGTFCVMVREKGNPISWRQLWKALIMSPGVEPFVLRRQA